MKTSVLLSLVCAVTIEYVSSAAISTLHPHVPLLLWSKRSVFNGKNAYISDVLDESNVKSTLESVLSLNYAKDAHNILIRDQSSLAQSEALCVFLRENLKSDQLSELSRNRQPSFVQTAVNEAKSSVVIPHTTRASALSNTLGDVKPTVVSIEDIQSWVKSAEGKNVLSNKKTDLLIVEIPQHLSLPEADELMKRAADALVKATGDNIDFALTGDNTESMLVRESSRRRLATTSNTTSSSICETGYILGVSNGKQFCFSHYVRMTPEVLTALLFGFFFIFLAYVGISMLGAIQTPLRYPSTGPPRGKEF